MRLYPIGSAAWRDLISVTFVPSRWRRQIIWPSRANITPQRC